MALSSEGKKAKAYELYVNSDFNQSEICEIVGVSDKTLREWRDENGWEEAKKANSITAPKVIALLNQKLYELSEGQAGEMVNNADKISKIAAAIDKLRGKELYLSNYIEVFKDFTNWLFTQGDIQKMQIISEEEVVVNGVEAAKLINLWMKDFIGTKIRG